MPRHSTLIAASCAPARRLPTTSVTCPGHVPLTSHSRPATRVPAVLPSTRIVSAAHAGFMWSFPTLPEGRAGLIIRAFVPL